MQELRFLEELHSDCAEQLYIISVKMLHIIVDLWHPHLLRVQGLHLVQKGSIAHQHHFIPPLERWREREKKERVGGVVCVREGGTLCRKSIEHQHSSIPPLVRCREREREKRREREREKEKDRERESEVEKRKRERERGMCERGRDLVQK